MSADRRPFPHQVIRASAGTGKTFQLSNRFIGLAAAGEPPDSMLATTFTRKAAGEILDRVLWRLAEAGIEKDKLAELAGQVGDAGLDRAKCLRMLHEMLRQLHRLRVGTLDSFFIQIAQSFSLELELPPGWKIVDEIVDAGLRAEAVRGMLRDESTRDTLNLMHLLTKGEASRSVSQQIASLVKELYGFYLEAPEGAWQTLPRYAPLKPPELVEALDILTEAEIPDDRRFQTARDQDLERAGGGDWEGFITKGLAAKVLGGTGTYYRKTIPAELAAAYEPLIQHAKAVLVGQIANQTEATRQLLERFDDAYQRLKTARHALRFEDVTGKLGHAELADRVDEVAYRLDAHVSHLLLDEFQDTSPLQWRALRPFARRVVARGRRRSFFCVGDVKQAIFGWRGGVAEIFEALEDDLDQLELRRLDRSWRSSPVVIDTVNRVFEDLAANAALRKYPDATQRWAARFQPHTTARTELPGHCLMSVAPRAAEDEDQAAVTLHYAAGEIATLHKLAPGRTIGVLLRRNLTVARLIYELRLLGVKASEEGGNPLTDSPAVQLVLSLLTLADHPGDTAARFHLANSPLAEPLGFTRYNDTAAGCRLSHRVRRRLMDEGYGPVIYQWVTELAAACDGRDLGRLMQLVETAYGYQPAATTRTDDFVNLVSQRRVEDPSSADVRVMTVHQAKGLQFDAVVLPELDVRLTGQTPPLVVGRPKPTADVQHVCRYVSKDIRSLLPEQFGRMFDRHQRQVVEEALCVLYVSLTRPVHALRMIIAPSRDNERTIPGTSAGLLRAALADGEPAPAGAVLYEHGEPEWFKAAAARRPSVAAGEAAPGEALGIKLAVAPARPSRGLDRRSPSQLEGGARVSLTGRMRLDTAGALRRGTLVHAWFEQIEWLEDGEPDDRVLQEVAAGLPAAGLDVAALIGQFRRALGQPAIRAALSRATYAQPDGGADDAIHAAADLSRPRWEVWRERPFVVRDGDAILSGTIDRLVVLYDADRPLAADVLDFKTDNVAVGDPQAIARRVEEYRPQLDAYRRAVAGLFGLTAERISARLAFVAAGIVRAV